jgi:RHS repeat-associated protein
LGLQRIKKVVGTSTTRYIYSGSNPIAEYLNGATTPSAEYIYAGSRLLVTVAGANTVYHHPDHLSNRAETDSSGALVRTYGQFPFGESWYETGTPNKWKFTSYERDSTTGETGLDYSQARYDSTSLGRFMSADLLGGGLATPRSLNRYAYVGGDPVNWTDTSGLLWGGSVLCLFDNQGNPTSTCAKFVNDPDLTSLACSGSAIPGSSGPSSFCGAGCPVWEMFVCGSPGTVLLIPQNQHTNPAIYSIGIGLSKPKGDGNAPISGTQAVCNLVTQVEDPSNKVCQPTLELKPGGIIFIQGDLPVPYHIESIPPVLNDDSTPAIATRGPFVPPTISPVAVVPR